jgi:hypothetical protein
MKQLVFLLTFFILLSLTLSIQAKHLPPSTSAYQDLVSLFREWRDFKEPPLRNGAPD